MLFAQSGPISFCISKGAGNDLSSPGPGFSGLKEGDRWCLCLSRWVRHMIQEWHPTILEATHESALEMVSLDKLKEYEYKKLIICEVLFLDVFSTRY